MKSVFKGFGIIIAIAIILTLILVFTCDLNLDMNGFIGWVCIFAIGIIVLGAL